MNLSFDDFLAKYNGQSNIGDTPENKGQCVGLIEVWLDNLNLNTPHLYGNAIDLLNNADKSKFDVIFNTPDNIPEQGDIVVFGKPYGRFVDTNGIESFDGHTGISSGKGDVNSFEMFEQNDPTGSNCHLQNYAYTSVIGWLHPKTVVKTVSVDSQTFETLVTKSTHYDEFVKIGYNNADDVTNKVSTLQTNLDEAHKTIGALQVQVNNLTLAEKQDKDTISGLTAQMQQMATSDSTAIDNGIQAESNLKQLQEDMKDIAVYSGAQGVDKLSILKAIDDLKTAHDNANKVNQKLFQSFQIYMKDFIKRFIRKR